MLSSKISVRSLISVSPSVQILLQCNNDESVCMLPGSFLAFIIDLKSQILDRKELPSLSQVFNCVSCCLNLARILLLIFLIGMLLLLPLEAEVIEAVEVIW